MGDTVHVSTTSNYTANSKSQGSGNNIIFEALTHPMNDILINTWKYAAVMVEDFAQKQAMPGYREAQTKKLGYALSRDREVALTAIFDAFADNGTVGTLGVDLTQANLTTAWQKMAESGAIQYGMIDEDLTWVFSPASLVNLLQMDLITHKDYGVTDGDAIKRAKVGRIFQGEVFMSNLLESDASGQHDNAFFHKDVLSLCVQKKPHVEHSRIIEAQADAIVAANIYGVKELMRPGESAANVTLTDNYGVYLAGK